MVLPVAPSKLIFPNGRDQSIMPEVRRRNVIPDSGDSSLRCGGCGGTDFTIHVKPGRFDAARMTKVICSICAKTWLTDNEGQIGGTLRRSKKTIAEREAINVRPED